MTQKDPTHRPISYKPSLVMEGAAFFRFAAVARASLLAAVVTLVLGSKALLSWTNDLPIGKISDVLLYCAQTWQDWMSNLGITHFADAAFNALRWLEALRW
ncbi:MAG: hypothetical protein WCD70_06080 [Alphaproteobacteria bacterium]